MSKILIIEDDPLMLRLYTKIFEKNGHEVLTSERGIEGIQKARNDKPELILLDIMMPEMDGFEVLSKLKADEITKNTPVIALTNLAGEADKERALKMGASKYVVKSEYDPKDVVDIALGVIETK